MKKFIEYFAVGMLAVLISHALQYFKHDRSKYKVYAAGHEYECNHFTISGKTIYFNDIDGKNVFINGDYSLVYEKELSKE